MSLTRFSTMPRLGRVFEDPFFTAPMSSLLTSPFPSLGMASFGSELTRTPTFDVSETPTAFRLQGELPGIDKDNLEVEFVDPQTLSIRGAISKTSETKPDAPSADAAPAPDADTKAVAPPAAQAVATKPDQPAERFWMQERVRASFHRQFRFPSPVDSSSVTASLRNGVLDVSVPKVPKTEPKRLRVDVN
ncbi:HSP20-like chaperone [Dipodascopsis tothii]|uniref:HSP20-like chaperone n=1 Tax=Dipodascopsis tothii TaxID=44089 RepID=UPI0034CE240A